MSSLDYQRALQGYGGETQNIIGFAAEKQQQVQQYSKNIGDAVASAKSLTEQHLEGASLSALAHEGAAAGQRYLKGQLTKVDASGKKIGSLGRIVDKIDAKTQSLRTTAKEDLFKNAEGFRAKANEVSPFSKGTPGFGDDTLEIPEAELQLPTSSVGNITAEGGDIAEGIGEAAADITPEVGSLVGEIAGEVGGFVGSSALSGLALGSEALGTALDATGIGAGIGVALNIAGVVEAGVGAFEGGKGIYDFITDDILHQGVNAAKAGVAKVSNVVEHIGSSLAVPTFDTSMNIHSSSAW